MCCGAILLARIRYVIWVMNDDVHGGLRWLHKKKDSLDSLYYEQRLDDLEISVASEQDLVRCMEDWVEGWNGEKETVLRRWRQRDELMLPS
jgi:tRNA(Arg) A34 adenosine deaminase TadA